MVSAPMSPHLANMLDLHRPDIGWVDLAKGLGVDGVSVTDAGSFARAMEAGTATQGPFLIEVVI